jgi:hypothetical protein
MIDAGTAILMYSQITFGERDSMYNLELDSLYFPSL